MNNIKLYPALLIFAEVAKKQSFTLAAKHLGMSKSAVSQQVKRLEQVIGQQLLSRNTRGMSLTANGEKLLKRCELLRDQVDLAFEELNSTKKKPSGKFAINVPHACERDIVIPALKQLCVEFPGIEPDVLVTDESRDLIQNNRDVAVYAGDGDLKDSNYRALPIGKASEVFYATPSYVQKNHKISKPKDLLKHHVIATPWQTGPLELYVKGDMSEKFFLNVTYFAKTNTFPTALEMVLQGMGIALLPEFAAETEYSNGNLVRLLPGYRGKLWNFSIVHRFQREKPVHVTRFYQLVKYFFVKANIKID